MATLDGLVCSMHLQVCMISQCSYNQTPTHPHPHTHTPTHTHSQSHTTHTHTHAHTPYTQIHTQHTHTRTHTIYTHTHTTQTHTSLIHLMYILHRVLKNRQQPWQAEVSHFLQHWIRVDLEAPGDRKRQQPWQPC